MASELALDLTRGVQNLSINDQNNVEEDGDIEVIDPQDKPTTAKWALLPLYNKGQNGALLYWRIHFDPVTNELITIHGQKITPTGNIGKMQTDRRLVVTNLSNRNIQEQALQEALKRYSDIYTAKGYRPIEDEETETNLKTQLAQEYLPPGSFTPGGKPKKSNIQNFPVACSSKIDGIRARYRNRMDPIAYSRTNRPLPVNLYIKSEVKELFKHLPKGAEIDGEYYIHGVDYNEIQGIVMTKNEVHANQSEIEYWIFDLVIPNMVTEERYNTLCDAYENCQNQGFVFKRLVIVRNEVANSYEEIDALHNQYVEQEYEGLMIRKFGFTLPKNKITESYYLGGRNNNLLKYKHFIDEEGVIIDVKEGTGREEGIAVFILRDKRGNEFSCRPKGKFEARKKWFQNPQDVIGKYYTFKYFELSSYGIPRFPTGKGFRRDM
jgi:ATP-dependent DNA ligase